MIMVKYWGCVSKNLHGLHVGVWFINLGSYNGNYVQCLLLIGLGSIFDILILKQKMLQILTFYAC